MDVEERTQELGRQLYENARRYRPSLGERLQDWLMVQLAKDAHLQNRVLRFLDVLAALDFDRNGTHVATIFREYFQGPFRHSSPAIRGLLSLGRSRVVPNRVLAGTSRWGTRAVASRFIAGNGEEDVQKTCSYLERHGRLPSFDILGEQVLSLDEATGYQNRYLRLADHLGNHPLAGTRTQSGVPSLQMSIKLSALTEDFNFADPTGTLQRVRGPLEMILEKCVSRGIGLTVDMEESEYFELTWYVFCRIFAPETPWGGWDGAGIVLQAYHVDAGRHLRTYLEFAQRRQVPFQVRLVKGAYWDYEVIKANEFGWPMPVFQQKPQTDWTYERLLVALLEHNETVNTAVASHNIRSHAYAEALREALGLPPQTLEHQTLFRTAEGISRAITSMGWSNRDYVPVGELIPGMAYLVRRVLENTSQVGVLMQNRMKDDVEELLRPPVPSTADPEQRDGITTAGNGFRNNPPSRLFVHQERESFQSALTETRLQWGAEYQLDLAGNLVTTNEVTPSLSPSDPDPENFVGLVHFAGTKEAERVVSIARDGFNSWSEQSAAKRAGILRKAADLMRQRKDQLAALVVHEGGRSWTNALGDVDEAIDHIAYAADQLPKLQPLLDENYRPRGVVAAIPPWNFPAALPMGMTSAALATGNAVILKSSEETPIIAQKLVEILHEAGVPTDALIHLPGRGEIVGAHLVESPGVDMVAFTGSKQVGLWVNRTAAGVRIDGGLKKVVTELGGKNAIIVFPDADLDEAVSGILTSTFEHANQKCSACSRVFVHRAVYSRLKRRLTEAARSLPVGRSDDPKTVVNPLISKAAKDRVLAYAQRAREEGTVLLDRVMEGESCQLQVGPMIVELDPARLGDSVVAREEVFGPLLALVPFDNEEQMLAQVNGTPYALTAGIFSRSPNTIKRITKSIRAGLVYVNRAITGARVGIEPFGGFQLSGTGPKTGSPEYLMAFVTRLDGYEHKATADTVTPVPMLAPIADKVETWQSHNALERGRILKRGLDLLRAEHWSSVVSAIGDGYSTSPAAAKNLGEEALEIVANVLDDAWEVYEPQPTLKIPGQRNFVSWETPRGKGYVATDDGTPPGLYLAMVLAPLLAGNGIVLAPSSRLRPLSTLFIDCLNRAGVPGQVVHLAAQGGPAAAAALADDAFQFAVVDMALQATRQVYERLAETRETLGQNWIKALISMNDGPRPGEIGFLRSFALPKTVVINTLRHGADLELNYEGS